jgi:hypothetical protein
VVPDKVIRVRAAGNTASSTLTGASLANDWVAAILKNGRQTNLRSWYFVKDMSWLYAEYSGYFDLYESEVIVNALRSEAFPEYFQKLSHEYRFADWHLELIASRFGLQDFEVSTLEELAERHGVSRERVRQIEQRFLAFLRHPKVFENVENLIRLTSLPKKKP